MFDNKKREFTNLNEILTFVNPVRVMKLAKIFERKLVEHKIIAGLATFNSSILRIACGHWSSDPRGMFNISFPFW